MKHVPKLKADLEYGLGGVTFPAEFDNEPRLVKLDLLQDWMSALKRKYDEAMASPD